jgi:thioredoxin-like negative regulator of GroEL
MPLKSSTSTEVKQKIKNGETLVVKFYSPSCEACEEAAPEIQAAACPYRSDAEFLEVNVDDDPTLADELKVSSIPAVAAFKDGQLVRKKVGSEKSDAYETFIKRFLNSK